MKQNEMNTSGKWMLAAAALFFLGLYITIAWLQNDFAFPNYDYGGKWAFLMAWISGPEFQSQLWKILLLLPAILLGTAALVKAGIRISIPAIIRSRSFIVFLLVLAAIVLAVSVRSLFYETELTDDENTYDFQAKTLLAGRIVNPPPPVPNNFNNVFIINDGSCWVGKYTLGHPLVIAFGMMFGSRYIGTIGLSILTLLLLYGIAKELYHDRKVALLALCLGAVSPFFFMVSSSRLSHTTTAFFLALFMYLFLYVRRTEKTGLKFLLSLLAGLSLGYAFNTRQMTAFGFVLPFIVVGVYDCWKMRSKALASGMLCGAGFMIIFALTLWYNALITNNPLQFPFHYYAPTEAIGFGINGYTPVFGLRNLIVNFFHLNGALFGFPLSLMFVFFMLFIKKDFGDRLAFGIIAGIGGMYFLYYSPGVSDLGPVYFYEMLIPLLILSARGIAVLHDMLKERFANSENVVPVFLMLSVFAALGTYVPEKIIHINRLATAIRAPYELVQSSGIHHAVVMIEQLPNKGWVFGYRSPSPLFTDDIVYCLFADPASNKAMMKYFQERDFYALRMTDKGNFRLIPIPQGAL